MASFSEQFARELGDILLMEKLANTGFFEALTESRSEDTRRAADVSAVGLPTSTYIPATGRGTEMNNTLAELYGTIPDINEKLAMLKEAADAGDLDLDGLSASELLEALEADPEEDEVFSKMAEEKKLAADEFGRRMAHRTFSEWEAQGEVPDDFVPEATHSTKTASERIAALLHG